MKKIFVDILSFCLKYQTAVKLVFLLAVACIPFLGLTPYVMRIIILSGIYIVLALSLNLLTGFTGQVSLGHAAFYGIGAYTSALMAVNLHYPFIITAISGGILAAVFGMMLGIPTLKLNGSYLSIVTLGFCEILRLIELNWMGLTRGPMGIPGIPSPDIFGLTLTTDAGYFYLILVIILITIIVVSNIVNSRTGRAMISIKEDELASEAMGVNVFGYKLFAFTISAFFAGIAGSFYAHYVSFIDPQSFTFDESILILSIVILGGMGSIPGTILGAVFLIVSPELLRSLQEYRMVIYGLVLVAMMLLRPEGIFGNIRITDIIRKYSQHENEEVIKEEVGSCAQVGSD